MAGAPFLIICSLPCSVIFLNFFLSCYIHCYILSKLEVIFSPDAQLAQILLELVIVKSNDETNIFLFLLFCFQSIKFIRVKN